MSKFSTLVRILDQIRAEAPLQQKFYHPAEGEREQLDQARSRAFVHLYLKVRFGLLDFADRESLITDGPYDGGIDAYFIDQDLKKITLIQAKFRGSQENFEEKQINVREVLRMDAARILNGEFTDEEGNPYNGKVKALIKKIAAIPDNARYKHDLVILANLESLAPGGLKKITGGFATEVFNFKKTYEQLVFPVVTGTFFNVSDLYIQFNLRGPDGAGTKITYPVRTAHTSCDITILFVPTSEVGKVLYKYKNSILRFNPRGFLELSHNAVNSEIADTIRNRDTNEFALFNNGITMLSDETDFNERVGQRGKGQLRVKNPQIINGGQTAFTLSQIWEEVSAGKCDRSVFDGKEVMIKVITFPPSATGAEAGKIPLIEAISKATNQQTIVNEADRRSNDKIQLSLQQRLFSEFGYFYERKRGEFADGLHKGYIDRSLIIDREMLLRVAAAAGGDAAGGRRSSKALFKKEQFNRILGSQPDAKQLFFGFKCLDYLRSLERSYKRGVNKYGLIHYGYGLRFGRYAVVTATILYAEGQEADLNWQECGRKLSEEVLKQWIAFEKFAAKQPANKRYMNESQDALTGKVRSEFNFDPYYKGGHVNDDLVRFFSRSKKSRKKR